MTIFSFISVLLIFKCIESLQLLEALPKTNREFGRTVIEEEADGRIDEIKTEKEVSENNDSGCLKFLGQLKESLALFRELEEKSTRNVVCLKLEKEISKLDQLKNKEFQRCLQQLSNFPQIQKRLKLFCNWIPQINFQTKKSTFVISDKNVHDSELLKEQNINQNIPAKHFQENESEGEQTKFTEENTQYISEMIGKTEKGDFPSKDRFAVMESLLNNIVESIPSSNDMNRWITVNSPPAITETKQTMKPNKNNCDLTDQKITITLENPRDAVSTSDDDDDGDFDKVNIPGHLDNFENLMADILRKIQVSLSELQRNLEPDDLELMFAKGYLKDFLNDYKHTDKQLREKQIDDGYFENNKDIVVPYVYKVNEYHDEIENQKRNAFFYLNEHMPKEFGDKHRLFFPFFQENIKDISDSAHKDTKNDVKNFFGKNIFITKLVSNNIIMAGKNKNEENDGRAHKMDETIIEANDQSIDSDQVNSIEFKVQSKEMDSSAIDDDSHQMHLSAVDDEEMLLLTMAPYNDYFYNDTDYLQEDDIEDDELLFIRVEPQNFSKIGKISPVLLRNDNDGSNDEIVEDITIINDMLEHKKVLGDSFKERKKFEKFKLNYS